MAREKGGVDAEHSPNLEFVLLADGGDVLGHGDILADFAIERLLHRSEVLLRHALRVGDLSVRAGEVNVNGNCRTAHIILISNWLPSQ